MTLQERVTQCLRRAVDHQETAGISVLVRQNGQEVLYSQAGFADLASAAPLRRDSIFRMFSMTKPIVSAAAMLLMERGDLDLMSPVSAFLPGFHQQKVATAEGLVPARRPVRIMDLLGMTAGLSYPDGSDEAGRAAASLFHEADQRIEAGNGMTTQELANRIGELPLAFQPGTRWRYSTCADVLGAVIEVVSGKPLAEFLADEFFTPLGMKDTAFFVPGEKQDRLVTAYGRTPEGLIPSRQVYFGIGDFDHMPAYIAGGGGLRSTMDDYASFADMLLHEGAYGGLQLLRPATVRFMTQPQLTDGPFADMGDCRDGFSYGKLMRVCIAPGLWAGMARQDEYGWDGMMGTYFANFPHERLSLVVMQNVLHGSFDPVIRKVRNVVLAELG